MSARVSRRRSRLEVPGTHELGFVEQPIVQQAIPKNVAEYWRRSGVEKGARIYRMGDCSMIVARELAGVDGERLWHLSISCPERHPTWDEIKVARYRLLPTDKCFGMLLPPPEHYVNVETQDHVFHLWEITDPREPWSGG